MHRRSGFPIIITLAVFVLTWSPDFTVEGVPRRHDQCQQRGYDVACEYDTKIKPCKVLTCGRREPDNSYISQKLIVHEGIPDGTVCGPSKICRNKECVDAREDMPQCPEENDLKYCRPRFTTTMSPIKTREEQCQDFGFDVACLEEQQSGDRSCQHLACGYKTSDGRNVRYRTRSLPIRLTPTIGTFCDVDKACYKLKCISTSKWPQSVPKPSYTGLESFWQCNFTNF